MNTDPCKKQGRFLGSCKKSKIKAPIEEHRKEVFNMKTIVKCLIGGALVWAGLDSLKDGVDVLTNGENSRLARDFVGLKNKLLKKNSTVSVDTVEFTVEDE